MANLYETTARDDFNRARGKAIFSRILNLLTPDREELLSLQEVRETLRPKGETYAGMQTVPIAKIVGSEGRYRDFNKRFLPRYDYLRGRWQSIDMAHLTDRILPPITLYEIGGVYFVRDGNHRVSVARAQGVHDIDAEVTSLQTEIPLNEQLTKEGLRRAVIEHEKQAFYKRLKFDKFVGYDLEFSEPGRYEVVENHILAHKYYLNERHTVEIRLEQAMFSWFNNVFKPIVDVIEEEHLMSRFPGRTSADLYLWIVRHWDDLKRRYGQDVSINTAAHDFVGRFGKGRLRRWLEYFGLTQRSKTHGPDA